MDLWFNKLLVVHDNDLGNIYHVQVMKRYSPQTFQTLQKPDEDTLVEHRCNISGHFIR